MSVLLVAPNISRFLSGGGGGGKNARVALFSGDSRGSSKHQPDASFSFEKD